MRRETFLAFSPPLIGEEEIEEVVAALRSGWITTGPRVKRFEDEFAAFVDAPGALALNSCTSALHTALVACDVGAGDEVIVSSITFASAANVVEHVGARPVFVDVEPDSLNMDPERVAEAVTPRTRAVMPVHFAGHPADMDSIVSVAQRGGLAVVEDAAHALPARYKGRLIGSGTNPAAFSFYATKNLTTGEGGMLAGEPEMLDRARVISLHGMSREALKRYNQEGDWFYEIVLPGFKYNMGDIQAAMGLWQLRKLPAFQQRRLAVKDAYHQAFRDEEALETPAQRPEVEHSWHLYVLRLCPGALTIDRKRFIEELNARNIGTSVHFIPVPLHPYYRDRYGHSPQDFPVALENYSRMLSLPINPAMTETDVADVIEAVTDVLGRFRR